MHQWVQGLRLWCLTPPSTIFQLYGGGQFFWWRKPVYLDKTTNLPQVADERYHKMLFRVRPACVGFEVIGTDFIGS